MRAWHRLAFGVVILAWPAAAAAAQPPEKTEPLVLLLNERVQDELQLDDAQRGRLRKLPDAVRARHQKQRDELRQQIKDAQEKTDQAQETFFKGVDAAVARLFKAEQVKRFKQIERQSLGLALLDDPEAAAALRLTDKQKQDFLEILRGLGKAEAEILARGQRITPQEAGKLRQKTFRALVGGLTDEQKATLKDLVGEPSPAATGRFPLGMVGRVSNDLRRSLRLTLLVSPELAEELKLSEAQLDDLKAAVREAQARAQKALPQVGDPPPQIRLTRLEQKMIDEARTEAEEILQPAQKRRLEQLAVQARGLLAFEDVPLLRALKLTPEQARSVEDASKGIDKRRQEFIKEVNKTKVPLKEALAHWAGREGKLHHAAVAGLAAGFTDTQKEAWEKQTGKAFDVVGAGINPSLLPVRRSFFNPAEDDAEVSPARAFLNAGTAAYYRAEYDRALAGFDECLHLDADNALASNSKAWLLATCPEEKYRDGLEAIRLARKACARTQDKVASFLDTLAAAYAEAGEFEEAVATQTRALEIAAPAERAEFAARLKLFREKKKYRETPGRGGP